MTRPQGRSPVQIEATSQRAREEMCTCPQPVPSGRVYFGAVHCALCDHLIDTWGTWK